MKFPRIKYCLLIALMLTTAVARTQELFSVTEPASNRAAGSITFRLDNSIMDETSNSRINYHMIPGVMIGISKKLMISGDVFFSNRGNVFRAEGGSIYSKYRFLSKDAMQKHFRMAVFGRISFNNSDIHQEEINMYGHNSGVEIGVVATKLLRKVAISSGLSFVDASDNGNDNKFIYGSTGSKAVNYTFSVGKLMLPREYSNYSQTNINLMVELLSQLNVGSGKYYMDVAPSVQLIFNSQSRVDIGYRKEITTTLLRTAANGFFIRLEYNLFNAFYRG